MTSEKLLCVAKLPCRSSAVVLLRKTQMEIESDDKRVARYTRCHSDVCGWRGRRVGASTSRRGRRVRRIGAAPAARPARTTRATYPVFFSRPRRRGSSYRTRAHALLWGGAALTLLRFRLNPFAEVRREACRLLAAPPSPAPASSLCCPACHLLRGSCDRRRLAHVSQWRF